jgi:hypothetical protein
MGSTVYLYVRTLSDGRLKRFYCSASVYGKYGIRYWMTLLFFALTLFAHSAFAQTPISSSCDNATGICTGSTYSFPASTNAGSAATGASYGCLTTRPNPAWFFLQIQNPGSITITMTSSPAEDIDFIIWGPFTDPFAQCVAGLTAAQTVACSYSTAATETGTIPNGLAGEYYVLLITNYSNDPTNITFSQTGGTGSSNCDILCNITSLTATPSACGTGASAGTYTVSGTVTSFTPPSTGTLTISSSCGGSVTFNAPFSTSQAYTLPAQPGEGGSCTITASYSAIPTCIRTRTITQPTCCAVAAGADITDCEGDDVNLTATTSSGGTFHWTGPNGFTSTQQNPTINNATPADAGTYSVYVVNGTCTSSVDNIVVTIRPIPNATVSADGPTTFCDNDDVTFSVTSGSGLSYRWRRNGSNIGGATNSTYTATTSGTYSVVVSNTGCGFSSATSSNITVVVNALPTATNTAGGALTFCLGDSVTLSANTGTGLTHQWTVGGVNISGATGSTYVAKTSGTYRVVVTNANGCSETSSSRTVAVNALPTATITPADSGKFCQGGSITLTANTGTGLTYQWLLNGVTNIGTFSSLNTGIVGNYTVVVTNSNGCKKTSAITVVSKYANPAATVTAGGAATFCTGDSVKLNATTAIGYTYQWKRNTVNISGATLSSYTATTSGSYTVTVAQSFCSGLAAVTSSASVVTVNALPTATITPSGSAAICAGDSVTLTANTGTGLTYKWSLNGSIISGATSSTYRAKVAGNYRVTVTNSSSCKDSSAITAVTVNTLPVATITPSDSAFFCQGGSTSLNATTGTGFTYQWLLSGSVIGTSSSLNTGIAGLYSVIITNSNGCKDTSNGTTVVVKYTVPTASITAGGPLTFCAGDSVKLNANTPSVGFTYQWKLNGSNIAGQTGTSYTATTSGSYTVEVTQSLCPALASVTSTAAVVTANPMPTATITPGTTTELCTGDTIILSANTGTGLTYQWQVGGSNISGQTSSQLTVTGAGNFTVKVTKTGCTTTSSVHTVNIHALPIASVSAGGPTTFCAGNSVLLIGNTGTGYTYQWKKSGSFIGSAVSNTYTADSSGSYVFVITDSYGCKGSSSATTVTANAFPPATITPVGATTFCQGSTVNLNANTGTGLTYQWKLDGTNISGATSSSLNSVSAAGSYVVVVTKNSCATSSSPAVVTVNARPPAGKLIIHE